MLLKDKIEKEVKSRFPNATKQQIVNMVYIYIYHYVENSKTLGKTIN